MQVVGTMKDVPGLLELCTSGLTVGQLPEFADNGTQKEAPQVFDKKHMSRLQKSLDILQRLGLLVRCEDQVLFKMEGQDWTNYCW